MKPDLVHKALGNETRKQILLTIAKEEKYLTEIANEIKLAPQTADFHLNVLTEIGLVGYKWKEGKKFYFVKDKKILDFLKKGKLIPIGHHPKPPHEIMEDMWKDMKKRFDKIEKRLDKIEKKIKR